MFWPALVLLAASLALAKDTQKQLVDLAAAGSGLIRLDAHSFDLLTAQNRNWSAAIQFTAMDKRRRCEPCKAFDPSWTQVAQAWSNTPSEHRDSHFFATLDFDQGQTVFQALGLTSAPVVYIYTPTEGPRSTGKHAPLKYDFSNGYEPGPLALQLSTHTPIPIPYSAPTDWARWATFAGGFFGFLSLIRFIAPILQNKWTWAVGTILSSLIMTSGYMFTQIRNVPFTGGNGQWIAPGYSNMYGQEVQVISLIYGVLSFSFLMLTLVIPYQTSPTRQRLQIYVWLAVIMIVYSVLVTLFKVKNRGYPFRLFL